MDLAGYMRAVRKGWWLVVLATVLGVGAGAFIVVRATPVYEAKLTFYVSAGDSSSSTTSPEATDLYLQDRATSYASLASSGRLASMVVKSAKLDLSAGAVQDRISGAAKLNTVLFVVTVDDRIPARALAIASAIGRDFPVMVTDLDKAGSSNSALALNVVSGPSVGSSPISPRKTLDLAAGFAAGLLIGLLLAVLRELLDTAVRSPEQLTELTGRPVLGEIAFDPRARKSPLFVDEDGGVRRSEEFRHLRTHIRFLDAVTAARVLVVTSSVEVEGKSSTAANLAVVAAENDSRVLLIEADLRRPSVSAYLGLENGSGLTNVLVGQVGVNDVLQRWGGDGLSVLASGPVPPNPSELLGSDRMLELLRGLRNEFDLIIIDTPPLLPVTDAAVLARHADGVLLVVRHGKTKRNQVQQSVRDLETVEARLLGTVLNMRPVRGADASSYGSDYTSDQPSDWPAGLTDDTEQDETVASTWSSVSYERSEGPPADETNADRRAESTASGTRRYRHRNRKLAGAGRSDAEIPIDELGREDTEVRAR